MDAIWQLDVSKKTQEHWNDLLVTSTNTLGEWEKLKFFRQGTWEQVHQLVDKPTTYPRRSNWYKALEDVQPNQVKCVILGQDPYPGEGFAMGYSFSTYPHVSPLPRTLKNIFREYVDDLGYPFPRTGDLSPWAKEGVLLLNTVLTVEAGRPNSHAGLGWEKLTYEIISTLGASGRVVFCLWGKNAQEYKAACKDSPVVALAHPSPLSASKGFFGSKPFSRVNEYLKGREIDWKLP